MHDLLGLHFLVGGLLVVYFLDAVEHGTTWMHTSVGYVTFRHSDPKHPGQGHIGGGKATLG